MRMRTTVTAFQRNANRRAPRFLAMEPALAGLSLDARAR
eukprot:COSAG06_NODE_62477_length_265_cov_0.602410_1_plen_38_part_01